MLKRNKMFKKHSIFRKFGIALALLTVVLIAVNILYIKMFCSTRQCFIVNITTIILVIWAVAFLYIVLKHSPKDK